MHNFKKTIRTTILFLLVFAVFSVAVMEFFFQGENYYYQDAREREELAGTLDTLVVGASHAERGIVSEIMNEELGVSCYNLATPTLPLTARYDLVKREISRNPVKTLYLEVSGDTVVEFGDRVTKDQQEYEGNLYYMGRIAGFGDRVSYFFRGFTPSQYLDAAQFFVYKGFRCLFTALKGKYRTRYDDPTRELGHKYYEAEDESDDTAKDNDDSADDSAAAAEKKKERDLTVLHPDYAACFRKYVSTGEIDESKGAELQKIVDLCKENGVQVIMIDVPVSTYYICERTDFDALNDWYVNFAEQNDIPFYDFNRLKNRDELFSDKTDFFDIEHLWNDGQDRFTETMCDILKRAEAGEDVSDLFYDTYEDYEKTQPYWAETHK